MKKRRHACSGLFRAVCIAAVLLAGRQATAATVMQSIVDHDELLSPDNSTPVIINSNTTVRGAAGDSVHYPVLTITTRKRDGSHADVTIYIKGGRSLKIGDRQGGADYYGALDARGTGDHCIRFTALPDSGGNWGSLQLTANARSAEGPAAENALSCCVFQGGGQGRQAMIECCASKVHFADCSVADSSTGGILFCSDDTVLYGTRIDSCSVRDNCLDGICITATQHAVYATISNCAIKGNQRGVRLNATAAKCFTEVYNSGIEAHKSYGLYCDGAVSQCRPVVRGNRFHRNGSYPMRIPAGSNLTADNTFTDNSVQALELLCVNIAEDTRWQNPGIPCIVKLSQPAGGGITVGKNSAADPAPTLSIESGTVIRFDPGLYLDVGYAGTPQRSGRLSAVGTRDRPVVFSAAGCGCYWQGIRFNGEESCLQSRLEHCIIEYGGADRSDGRESTISFSGTNPHSGVIKNCTIRYSSADGIYFGGANDGELYNCNIYGNALRDISHAAGRDITARRIYWGTANGPSRDLCSSAVVGDGVAYEPWLAEELTSPFCFTGAEASKTRFNPLVDQTEITFSLSERSDWTLGIFNSRQIRVWSAGGTDSTGACVVWNGLGDFGALCGQYFYRIDAAGSAGAAAPVVGRLFLGDAAIARISEPGRHSLFAPGTHISITGTALPGPGGFYEVLYGPGQSPAEWTSITGPVYGSAESSVLATWDTSGVDLPDYTVKLTVHSGSAAYTDIAPVRFYVPDGIDDNATAVRYSYDCLGRMRRVVYPGGGSVGYGYDRRGNRTGVVQKDGEEPTLLELGVFTARPTMKGVVLQWQTVSEIHTAGFRMRRKAPREKQYTPVTPALIPGRGGPESGAWYSCTDVPEPRGKPWEYMLEEIDTRGNSRFYGPVRCRDIRPAIMLPAKRFRVNSKTACE